MEILVLVNRTNAKQVFTFDSNHYELKPGGKLMLSRAAALHGHNKLIAKLDPITGEAIFLTGLMDQEGKELRDCSEISYEREKNEELLDRTNMEGKFKTVSFTNPNENKSRVLPIQHLGGLSELVKPAEEEGATHGEE